VHILFIALLAGSADAYETDQLTERYLPLEDILEAANAHSDKLLTEAAAATNEAAGCTGNRDEILPILAEEIHNVTGKEASVPERGELRGKGYTMYSVWMESGDNVDRRAFMDPRNDIYSDLNFMQSIILSVAGTNSTFNLNGVLVGSDKPDHFWDLGYWYLRKSKWGEYPLKGIRHGTATEYGIYGLFTSKTFSYADLKANYDGYIWFDRLLTEDSELQFDDKGCVARVGNFDWAEWVNWEWDETMNPNTHTKLVENGIQKHLRANKESYCKSFEELGGADFDAHIQRTVQQHPFYADGAPTKRWDPYRLAELCSAG